MSLTITERPDVTGFKSAWADMVEAIEPDIDSLPEPWKSVFDKRKNKLHSKSSEIP